MRKWSLNSKIILIVMILAGGGLTTSSLGLNRMGFIKSLLTEISGVPVKRDQLTSQILDQQRQIAIANRDLIIERDLSKMVLIEKDIRNLEVEMNRILDEYFAIATPEGKEITTKFKSVFDDWKAVFEKVRELGKQNRDNEVSALLDKEELPLRKKLKALLADMNVMTTKRLQEATQASEESYVMAFRFLLLISFIVIVSGLTLAFFIMRAVSQSIDQVIRSLDDNSNQVSGAAQQVASSAEQLSQAATEQASSLEETASAIEELSSMVQKNTENANKSTEVSHQSEKSANQGKQVVEEMIAAIESINNSNNNIMQQIEQSNSQISEIVKVISEIGNKTKVINDIVFQTKLLSFNASVEAARAGEHGKGFAVVAEEVGNLAQMSGNAAKEISSMLEGSIQKVEGIVNETKSKVEILIKEGKEKVEAGTQVAQQCGEVLNEIVGNVSSVAQMMTEIAASSREQSQGVQEITKAMSQLDQVTQENASTSEEAASAAEELSSQAESLRRTIGVLIETIKGDHKDISSENRSQIHSEPTLKNVSAVSKSGASDHPPTSSKVIPLQKAATKKASVKKTLEGSGMPRNFHQKGLVPSQEDPRFKDV